MNKELTYKDFDTDWEYHDYLMKELGMSYEDAEKYAGRRYPASVVAGLIPAWLYEYHKKVEYYGDGKTNDGKEVLYIDTRRLTDDEVKELEKHLQDTFGKRVSIKRARSEYAPEQKKTVIIIDDTLEESATDDYKYIGRAFFQENYRGLSSNIRTNDYDDLFDWVWKNVQAYYIEVKNQESGKTIRLNPDDYDFWLDDLVGDKIENDLGLINESIKEGVSKDMTPEEIAKKHKVSVDKINKQLEKGIKVEKEHTDDEKKARRIALDHLFEIPDYYDRLGKMEKGDLKEDIDRDDKVRWWLDSIRDNPILRTPIEGYDGLWSEVVRYRHGWKSYSIMSRGEDLRYGDKLLIETPESVVDVNTALGRGGYTIYIIPKWLVIDKVSKYYKSIKDVLIDKGIIEESLNEDGLKEDTNNSNGKYVVSLYEKYPLYEPAEGGYYYDGIELIETHDGFETLDKAKEELVRWAKEEEFEYINDEYGYAKDKDRWEYIGEGQFMQVESNVDDDYDDVGSQESGRKIYEDTIKTKSGKWVNKGKEGTHGTFKTKKAADAQRRAIWVNWKK